VETWANVSAILQKNASWFASYGTEKSKGTKTFSLVGKVVRTGLIEVPMGISLREIIYGIGGGILGGKKYKATQTGGPSGGCLPTSFLDSPVDYESLAAAGSIVGSGGMVVMDENTCMVDVARYFLNFTQSESCGKCVMCRLGTKQMLDILEEITHGKGRPGDIELLLEVGDAIKNGSLCALGGTAPNPVLTTIRYFRDEYEAHINEKRCPALACRALVSYYIISEKCQGCGICAKACASEAIKGGKRMVHVIDQAKCVKCGTCFDACPAKFSAVAISSGVPVKAPAEPVPVGAKA
jgi:NADH:ubiquinone oxidoreductase subunit F (NADH-binding)/Fe-S-cluster-containing hydrogenase component 2